MASAVAWWLYAVYETGLFSAITAPGLALYLFGLAACYAIGYYAVRIVAWLAANSRTR